MERKIVLFCVLVLTLCSPAPAQGGFYKTADALSASCRIAIRTWSEQNPNSIDLLIAQSCNGYLQGALDAFEFDRVTGSQRSDAQSVCVPDDVKSDQVIRVFLKYSDDHPEQLHKAAPVVIWEAMHQAFACAVGK